jgi:hypothetical protein
VLDSEAQADGAAAILDDGGGRAKIEVLKEAAMNSTWRSYV